MQIQDSDPRQVISTYLLHSPTLDDNAALLGSIHILKEQMVGQLMHAIVSYQVQYDQQFYAHIVVGQKGPTIWQFCGFGLMGGYSISELSQPSPPQIAWEKSVDSDGTTLAIAVIPNEVEVVSIQVREGPKILYDEQLQNNAMFFFNKQQLQERLEVELYDHTHTFIASYFA